MTKTLTLRPEVLAFAQEMERRLQHGDKKYGGQTWESWDDPGVVADHASLAVAKLDEAAGKWLQHTRHTEASLRHELVKRAADLANYAMMTFVVCGAFGLRPTPKDAETIASEAYQIISALMPEDETNLHPEFNRALDYFSTDWRDPGTEILPWAVEMEPTPAQRIIKGLGQALEHAQGKDVPGMVVHEVSVEEPKPFVSESISKIGFGTRELHPTPIPPVVQLRALRDALFASQQYKAAQKVRLALHALGEPDEADVPCNDAVIERVVNDLRSRSRLGEKKYGVTLEKSGLSPAQFLQHAYEETLDLANYLNGAIDTLKTTEG